MATAQSFPLVRGRMMRVTKTDGCCGPVSGPDSSAVTEGFVSVALTANITEPEEITVTNANGKICVRDPGSPTFAGYAVDITFCEVQPCVFSMLTGQPVVTDSLGEVIGFKMNSKVALDAAGFALEVWMGVPGVACEAASGGSGYLLLPCLQGGVIGDFTIENAAVTFTVTGASTKDGNGWGVGPYPAHALDTALDANDHLYVAFSEDTLPTPTDGCVALTITGQLSATVDGETATLAVPRETGGCWGNPLTIDWGDGSEPEMVDATTPSVGHEFAEPGTYVVVVSAGAGCPDATVTVTIP